MNKFLLAMTAVLFSFVVNIDAQATKNRPILKPTKPPVAKEPLLPAEYEIKVLVLKGLGLFSVGITPTPTYPATNESSFQAFLNDHFGVKKPAPLNTRREYPKIVVTFDKDDDISTLVNAINLVRVSDKAVVELEALTREIRLIVSRKMTEEEMINVKPNPLTLIVEMNEQKRLTLNNEETGNLSDMSPLVTHLKDIYSQREKNGIFRENSNDIEKTVFIKMPLTASGDDLIKIAKSLEDAGADRIGLQVDESLNERRLELIDVPTIPPPKKKPIR